MKICNSPGENVLWTWEKIGRERQGVLTVAGGLKPVAPMVEKEIWSSSPHVLVTL